jgi:hypothetical protein
VAVVVELDNQPQLKMVLQVVLVVVVLPIMQTALVVLALAVKVLLVGLQLVTSPFLRQMVVAVVQVR